MRMPCHECGAVKQLAISWRRIMPITCRCCKSATIGNAMTSFSTKSSKARSKVSSGVSGRMSLRIRSSATKSGPRSPAWAAWCASSRSITSKQTVLRVDHGQHRVERLVEMIQHRRQRVAGLNDVEDLLANQELADVHRSPALRGRNSLDGPASGSGSPPGSNRSIVRPRAGTPARRPTAPARAGGSRPSSR